ncbi:HK97 family phage prohead protease [Dielma fastidiosa]|uniref:HK97 family phage prohead protease n=1 Tax=Dielma fastidiosa TaxID=1034346 RepID=UPI0023F01CDB|nr:HK97 family phage prohead protease [Dielma fastidiosa]
MPKFEKPKMSDICRRSFNHYEARENENDENVGIIEGVPIVFEQKTDIGGWFEETIARGAISEDVLRDVALFYNHDLNTKPHARTRNGRLSFNIENDGVHMNARVNLDRSDSKDFYLAVRDGDIDGMSFMFRVEADEWTDLDTDYPKRRITKIGYVQEVSGVNYPAYDGTSINARTDGSLDSDKKALDSARAALLDSDAEKRTLELEKLKAKYLFKIGGTL